MKQLSFIAILAACLSQACSSEPPDAPLSEWQGSGVATFSEYEPLEAKPLRLFYYVPANAGPNSPVVLLFHGDQRNAMEYRDAITHKAIEYGFIAVAPEFSEANFPGLNAYQLGNLFQDGENPTAQTLNPAELWTFSLAEPIFYFVKNKTKTRVTGCHMIGHSGGAQYLHRLLLYKPRTPVEKAVISAAGWYTLPDASVKFPYGLGESPYSAAALPGLFARKLFIQVGSSDNNPGASGLRRNPEADLQGSNRLERAQYFFQESGKTAQALAVPFEWELHIIPGLSHDFGNAVSVSADLLFK